MNSPARLAPVRFALVGKSGSGKSRAGAILSERFEVPHIRTGSICRQIARLLLGNEDKSSTQRLDDALTAIDSSIFLRAALRETTAEQGFVIDALRFESDLLLAREYGCQIIRIWAPEHIRVARLIDRGQAFNPETDGRHRSEQELDGAIVDHDVVNDGDLPLLEAALARIEAQV